ncbi:MAG: TetR/AcrR family transcriptional regulator [Salinigranum sp.]
MDRETFAEIMEATGRALRTHGYADLTMQRIADESSMTTAAIHYHFDTKNELLNAFLEDLIERFEGELACEARDPRERLEAFLDVIFTPVEADDDDDDFPIALMELKAQAPYHETYRERFLELDETMRDVVATAVRDGIDEGYFEESDPEAVARAVVTAINGSHVRRVALGEDPEATRRAVGEYLALRLGWSPEVVA